MLEAMPLVRLISFRGSTDRHCLTDVYQEQKQHAYGQSDTQP